MRIGDCYPTPTEFINCEFKTLEFIKNNFYNFQELSRLADDAYAYYSAQHKRDKISEFSFESSFDIKVDRKSGCAHVGARIELENQKKFKNISYYMIICKQEDQKNQLLRKYHFDYEPTGSSHRQPHPVFHLQYGGQLSQKLEEMDIYDSHSDPGDFWLSEPRLCCMPISLALLVNLILKEFPDEKNSKLIERSEWRDLVKKNEELILSPFFEGCRKFFSRNESNRLFLNDFYYGN